MIKTRSKSLVLGIIIMALTQATGSLAGAKSGSLTIKEPADVRAVLDALLANKDSIYGREISLGTTAGTFQGELQSRGAEFVVLRHDVKSNVISGPAAGKKIAHYSYVAISSINAVVFEAAE